MFARSTSIALAASVLCVCMAACGAERDACEQVADKQQRLIAADPDLDQYEKEALAKELRAARGRLVDLCREAVARDGASAQRALDCSLRASSLRELSKCASSPTFAQGFDDLRLGRSNQRPQGAARAMPPAPPTAPLITDDAPPTAADTTNDPAAPPVTEIAQ